MQGASAALTQDPVLRFVKSEELKTWCDRNRAPKYTYPSRSQTSQPSFLSPESHFPQLASRLRQVRTRPPRDTAMFRSRRTSIEPKIPRGETTKTIIFVHNGG